MESFCKKRLFPCLLLLWFQCLTKMMLVSAGEATTSATKDVQFSGWRPLTKSESLNTTQFVEKFSNRKDDNSTEDISTSETRRSFLLVYPPRRQQNGGSAEQHSKPGNVQNNQGRNNAPPVRASPTQSRYHRMMNFGASEGSNKRVPAVFQSQKFPPVANPPPLPPHVRRNPKKHLPNFTPESTSQHQVQIQLLDGYIVPPSAGAGISTIHAKDKGSQITTFPLSLNNVPEIRLLLPGDVHEQLNNLRHPVQQQNHPPKAYPEPQNPVHVNKDNPDHVQREYQNAEVKVPNAVFESQRYPDVEGPRNHVRQNNQHGNNNYEAPQIPVETSPQQNNYNQNYNPEQQRPQNEFSQPDPSSYANVVSFPGQNNNNFQSTNNQGQNYANELSQNYEVPNGVYQNNHQQGVYQQQQQVVRDQGDQVKTQSFSQVQRNRYAQNTEGQHQQNGEQVYTQMSNQAGIFPAYPSQVQRGYRGESFRPLSNGNHNNNAPNQGQGQSGGGGHQQNANYGNFNQNNNQHNNNQNLGQNAWRAQQPNRGKTHDRVLISPEQQNFYNINNQNTNQQKTNYNNFGQNNRNQNAGGTNYRSQSNSGQAILNQQILTETNSFSSTQSNGGQQISTGVNINTQQYPVGDNRNISTQGIPTDEIYFIPPLPSQDDVQTQIPAFDVPSTVDGTVVNDIGTTISRDDNNNVQDTTIVQEKELESTNAGLITTTGGSRQFDAQIDRSGSCDCNRNCAPIQRFPDENFGSSIREIARSLNAEAFFEFVGLSDDEIEAMLSTDGSYTLFIPSNEAVSRLPSNLIDHWRQNNPDFTIALLNHVIMDAISLNELKQGGRLTSRANDATIFVNNYNNEAVTVNGHRIVHGDVSGPKGGLIHVIDGTLCPVADQDIISTLRTCNKYDGFLTLADVTKLLDTMKEGGPYTVFLPSNEALTKIPSEELAILKENVTLLREFLEYHIVQGAYFSGDLKDGQYLTSLHQRQPIRVGIRVDGCYRRLVEANNSPLFKSDIPTKNGVIHITDWILSPSDLNWCEGVILP